MATWAEFEREAPEIAAAGRMLLYQGPTAYGFLGTVRRDGGPRMHPICPVIAEGRLWAFIVNLGYKYFDLVRDGRFALHSFPTPAGGEEFYATGVAATVDDADLRASVVAATGGILGTHDFEALFSFDLDHTLHTKWTNWGSANTWPEFAKWKAT